MYNFWSRREQEVREKLERWASTHQTMEMSYLWRRSSWLEQSEEWRHQGAGMYNFWSRMGQEVREKCRGEPIHTRQWRWVIFGEGAAGRSRVKHGWTTEQRFVIFGEGGSRRLRENAGVNHYTTDNVYEVFSEKERLGGTH
jgi:hypothetical protein